MNVQRGLPPEDFYQLYSDEVIPETGQCSEKAYETKPSMDNINDRPILDGSLDVEHYFAGESNWDDDDSEQDSEDGSDILNSELEECFCQAIDINDTSNSEHIYMQKNGSFGDHGIALSTTSSLSQIMTPSNTTDEVKAYLEEMMDSPFRQEIKRDQMLNAARARSANYLRKLEFMNSMHRCAVEDQATRRVQKKHFVQQFCSCVLSDRPTATLMDRAITNKGTLVESRRPFKDKYHSNVLFL